MYLVNVLQSGNISKPVFFSLLTDSFTLTPTRWKDALSDISISTNHVFYTILFRYHCHCFLFFILVSANCFQIHIFLQKKNAKDENKRSELSKSYHCVSAQSLKYRDKDQIET